MRRYMIAPAALVTFASIALGGAAQASRNQTAQGAPVVRITVTGCVQPTDQSTTSGRTTDTKYMLNNAKAKNGANDTTGKRTESQNASRYRLDAEDSRLAPESGHQVEIVAIVEEPESPTPAGTTGSKDATNASANAPKLKVETIKTIAVTCTQ